MGEPTRNPGASLPDDPARTKLAPDETADLPAVSAGTAHDTPRRADTSVEPGAGVETATYHPPAESFDPARTGLHTPAHEPDVEAAGDGPTVAGYEILEEIARGGMGVVYRARQVALDRVVALKMILAGAYAAGETVARFEAEARAVARFQHPNIVQVFEVGRHDGLPYFSLEFVEGGTLAKKIAREPQPPVYAAETVEKLARAVQYAHDRGIVHRDLKPANVLLAADGTPKITDFGLAKSLEGDSGQTQSGQVLGTPSYMAPEQARGDVEAVGAPADVWALGAILYDLLTGRPPFAGSSVLDTLEMVRWRDPVPPSQLTGKLPRDLETVCLKCLQKERAKRYASPGELADDLRRFLDGRPIMARPVGRVERAWRWAKRNPAGAALVIVPSILAVLLLIATGQAMANANRENAAKTFAQGKQKEAEDALAGEKAAKAAEEAAKNKESEAKQQAIDSATDAADQRNYALLAIRDVLRDVDDQMRHKAGLAPARLRIIAIMLDRLDKVRESRIKNPLDDRTEAIAYSRIGSIYYDTNRVEKAEEWTRRAYTLLKKLADENPKDAAALFNLAGISNQLANIEWRLGNGQKARDLYADALKLRQAHVPLIEAQLKEGKVKDIDLQRSRMNLATSCGLVAFADLRLGDPTSAVENYIASDKGLAALKTARTLPVRRMRAEIQVRLGDARLRQGRLKDAEEHYRAALAERETLLKITSVQPYHNLVKGDIAQSRLYLGDFFLMGQKDVAVAVAEYRVALKLFGELLKGDPDNLDFQQRVAAAHYRLGYAATRRSGFARLFAAGEAGQHFGECLKLREPLARIDPRDAQPKIELMLVLGRLGRAADAEKLADELLALKNPDPQVMFQIACGLAVASGGATDRALAARCRDKAFGALDGLVMRGWKSGSALELDPDLESLRADPRFEKVVAGLSPRPQK